jgi:hypothetical protein
VRGEVQAQHAGVLGPVEQLDRAPVGLLAQLLELARAREGLGEHLREAAVAGLHRADPVHQPAEAVPRVGVVQRPLDQRGELAHPVAERRGDEQVAAREPAQQGGQPDPGPAGDLVHRRAEALLGEHHPGGLDDPLAVAARVGPQRRGRRDRAVAGGHRLSVHSTGAPCPLDPRRGSIQLHNPLHITGPCPRLAGERTCEH